MEPEFKDLQSLFETSITRLVSDGRRSFNISKEVCMYKSSYGAKCAIGHLFPEELYSPAVEEASVYRLVTEGSDVRKDLSGEFLEWIDVNLTPHSRGEEYRAYPLINLQEIHDNKFNWVSVENFKRVVFRYAETYNLNADFIETLDFSNFVLEVIS